MSFEFYLVYMAKLSDVTIKNKVTYINFKPIQKKKKTIKQPNSTVKSLENKIWENWIES